MLIGFVELDANQSYTIKLTGIDGFDTLLEGVMDPSGSIIPIPPMTIWCWRVNDGQIDFVSASGGTFYKCKAWSNIGNYKS